MTEVLEIGEQDSRLPAPLEQVTNMITDRYIYGLKASEVAEKYGISGSTYRRWMRMPAVLEIRLKLAGEGIKERLAAGVEDMAIRLLDSMNDAVIKEMSGLQRLTGVGIAIDKARLLRGEATEIYEHRLDPQVIEIRKAEIVTELHKRGMLNLEPN